MPLSPYSCSRQQPGPTLAPHVQHCTSLPGFLLHPHWQRHLRLFPKDTSWRFCAADLCSRYGLRFISGLAVLAVLIASSLSGFPGTLSALVGSSGSSSACSACKGLQLCMAFGAETCSSSVSSSVIRSVSGNGGLCSCVFWCVLLFARVLAARSLLTAMGVL